MIDEPETPEAADPYGEVLLEALDRFKRIQEAESDNRHQMLDDVRFESGDQWPDRVKRMRETDPDGPRPTLVFNQAKKHKNALLNDIRQNRPQIKVLPADDSADPEVADMLNGLLRHIQVRSDADIAYDVAAENQIVTGLGYFQVTAEVVDEATNEQEVRISQIASPFSVYMDEQAEHPAGADAEFCFVTDDVRREVLLDAESNAQLTDWEEARGDPSLSLWYPDADMVRIANYWRIETYDRVWVMTPEGEMSEDEYEARYPDEVTRPPVPKPRIESMRRAHWYRMLGNQVLDDAEFPSQFIPIIRVVGEHRIVDGKRDYRGLIRDMKDPCRMANYWRSLNTEMIALAPKAPFIASAEALEGYESDWAAANTSNKAYLPHNALDERGNELPMPKRADPIQANAALIQATAQADDDVRNVSGQFEATFGEQGNETSGRAILARGREGDKNTYHYVDNLTRSLKHAGRVLVEIIPALYDTRRVVRILGEDNSPGFAVVDPTIPDAYREDKDAAGKVEKIYNPSVGKYDVIVSVGPSYLTRRQESAEAMTEMVRAAPDLMAIIGDKLVRAMDWPGADEMADRLKELLPPQIKQLEEAKEDGANSAAAQFAQAQEAVMQQIAPMVEQLQASLAKAGQDVAAKDKAIEDLQAALKDKGAELKIKARDVELDHAAAMAKVDADIVTATIAAGGQEDAPAGAPAESPGPASAPVSDMANVVAAQASQTAVGQMEQMADGMAAIIQEMRAANAQALQASQASAEVVEDAREQAAQESIRRSQATAAVMDYLKGPQTEEAMRETVRTIETLH